VPFHDIVLGNVPKSVVWGKEADKILLSRWLATEGPGDATLGNTVYVFELDGMNICHKPLRS
jgi:hypothetical protein